MFNKKIMYVLALLIIVSLSMNAFSALDIDDLNSIQLQPGDTANIVTDDDGNIMLQINTQTDYSELGDDNQNGDQNGDQNGNQNGDQNGNQNGNQNTDSNNNGCSTDDKKTSFNGTGGGGFDFSNMTGGNRTGSSFNFGNMTGGNRTGSSFNFNLSDIFSKLFSTGNDTSNSTTNATNQTAPQASDVPEVVTSANYKPVSSPSVEKISQHIIKRVRDNKIVSQGDTLKLEGINKLYDSDFTNGHLLVYLDNNLVFNEITADDLSTPIMGITDDLVGQHVISVEFTSNSDSNSAINKYTENVTIE